MHFDYLACENTVFCNVVKVQHVHQSSFDCAGSFGGKGRLLSTAGQIASDRNNTLCSGKSGSLTSALTSVSFSGEHKLNFIPAMIGPFLEVTLVPQPDLRNVMIPIFHDMMDWEQRRSGNFKQVHSC